MNQLPLAQAIKSDLAWILAAPALLSGSSLLFQPKNSLTDFNLDRLSEADLVACVAARSGKLGRYFECLVALLFKYSANFEILAQNHIIHSQERTLGEVDLLVKELATGDIIHLEVALKFYLFSQSEEKDPAHCWLGAGCHDFLKAKVNRLFKHQINLSDVALRENCWPKHLPLPTQKKVWITGRLFLPSDTKLSDLGEISFGFDQLKINPRSYCSHWVEEPLAQCEPFIEKAAWISNHSFTVPTYKSPAQIWPKQTLQPLFVLPANWQNKAKSAIEHYWNSK